MANASSVPTYQSQNGSVPAVAGTAIAESHGTAIEFLRLLASELSTGAVDLPCFPDVVLRIRSALDNPNTKPEKIVTVIGTEPRLSARLLQTANSAAFNTSGKPLVDLRSAITRLGYQMVQSATMSYAVQQMKQADSLRAISKQLSALWSECIVVASVCQAVATRTKISPDEAFLTGLLHGIGRLYIMARSVSAGGKFGKDEYLLNLVADWHPQIGKAVLENWGFAEEMSNAVGDQSDLERRKKYGEELTDILVCSVVLSKALQNPALLKSSMTEATAFHNIGLTEHDCLTMLNRAQHQISALHEALGC
jgi:HD-like signal output (HDOD) protein